MSCGIMHSNSSDFPSLSLFLPLGSGFPDNWLCFQWWVCSFHRYSFWEPAWLPWWTPSESRCYRRSCCRELKSKHRSNQSSLEGSQTFVVRWFSIQLFWCFRPSPWWWQKGTSVLRSILGLALLILPLGLAFPSLSWSQTLLRSETASAFRPLVFPPSARPSIALGLFQRRSACKS